MSNNNQETSRVELSKLDEQELGNAFYQLSIQQQNIKVQLDVVFQEMARREEERKSRQKPIVLPPLKKKPVVNNINELQHVTGSF